MSDSPPRPQKVTEALPSTESNPGLHSIIFWDCFAGAFQFKKVIYFYEYYLFFVFIFRSPCGWAWSGWQVHIDKYKLKQLKAVKTVSNIIHYYMPVTFFPLECGLLQWCTNILYYSFMRIMAARPAINHLRADEEALWFSVPRLWGFCNFHRIKWRSLITELKLILKVIIHYQSETADQGRDLLNV